MWHALGEERCKAGYDYMCVQAREEVKQVLEDLQKARHQHKLRRCRERAETYPQDTIKSK